MGFAVVCFERICVLPMLRLTWLTAVKSDYTHVGHVWCVLSEYVKCVDDRKHFMRRSCCFAAASKHEKLDRHICDSDR